MLSGSLHGVHILDLTRLFPGPLCTLMMVDLGAEVIKIEPLEGEMARYLPPFQHGTGSTFLQLNRGKRSLAMNLKSDKGREVFFRLLKRTDVLVESFRPGTMDRLGLGYERLRVLRPELVYASITAYGQDSPTANEPGHDLNMISVAGILSLSGSSQGLVIPPVQIADVLAGFQAGMAICAALLRRFREGKGGRLDISMLDGAFFTLISLVSMHQAGSFPHPPALPLSGGLACYNIYRTADDRYLALGLLESKFWKAFCERTGLQHLVNAQMQPDQSGALDSVRRLIAGKTLRDWLDFFQDSGLCISPVQQLPEALADPRITARNLLIDVDYPAGTVSHFRTPFVRDPLPSATCPSLGESNREILAEVGYSEEEIEGLRNSGVIP
jgi:crotonobetainyl-CoA:carnitine CoA-transferase CaiB-like acyl-CoA transferase